MLDLSFLPHHHDACSCQLGWELSKNRTQGQETWLLLLVCTSTAVEWNLSNGLIFHCRNTDRLNFDLNVMNTMGYTGLRIQWSEWFQTGEKAYNLQYSSEVGSYVRPSGSFRAFTYAAWTSQHDNERMLCGRRSSFDNDSVVTTTH